MNIALIPRELRPICEKVLNQERISDAEALALYASNDLNALGSIANIVRERKNGNLATYILNRYINYSNVCLLSCQFCAFGAKKRDEHAFENTIPELVAMVEESLKQGVTEVHMVGGLHPTLKAEWYLELIGSLRALDPSLQIKAFTAIEVRHLAERIFKKPIRETLEILREAGLNALTGGGAEIFDPEVRDKICRGKETAEEWLEAHRIWHEMGERSTCTMLFGHIETMAQRVDHLSKLRQLQDQTGGFTALVPFAFVPNSSRKDSSLVDIRAASAFDELRNLAVSRIYLDNFDHITAYWISMGLSLASVALNYGVDDLHGTIMEEKIFHMAGSQTPQQQTVSALERAIREGGRIPMQRDTFYRHIQPEATASLAQTASPARTA